MVQAPSTRFSLLYRLRNTQDRQAWEQFVEIYAPLVYGYARKHGLQDADAADLMQEVLRSVASATKRHEHDPTRGSFRGWLFTIVRNKLRNFLVRSPRYSRGSGGSAARAILDSQPARAEADWWEQEYEQRLFGWAAEQVRGGFHDVTWEAFWRTAVDGQRACSVAQALGISVGAVYIAKSRVLARLREQIKQLETE